MWFVIGNWSRLFFHNALFFFHILMKRVIRFFSRGTQYQIQLSQTKIKVIIKCWWIRTLRKIYNTSQNICFQLPKPMNIYLPNDLKEFIKNLFNKSNRMWSWSQVIYTDLQFPKVSNIQRPTEADLFLS